MKSDMSLRHVLVAEDDPTSRALIVGLLNQWGIWVTEATDGEQAWSFMCEEHAPHLVLLDWMMPGMDGPKICYRARSLAGVPPYIIMVTGRHAPEDIAEGLAAGASDYVKKPFDARELQARIQVGFRMVELQHALANRVTELKEALTHVRTLQGILPICMHCRRIRDDAEAWLQIEDYLAKHTDVRMSHGLCRPCFEEHYSDEARGDLDTVLGGAKGG